MFSLQLPDFIPPAGPAAKTECRATRVQGPSPTGAPDSWTCLASGSLVNDCLNLQLTSLNLYFHSLSHSPVSSYSSNKFLFPNIHSSSFCVNPNWWTWHLEMESCHIKNIIDMALALESDNGATSNLHWTVIWARDEPCWYLRLFSTGIKLNWFIQLCSANKSFHTMQSKPAPTLPYVIVHLFLIAT